jgi:hypothetical protein
MPRSQPHGCHLGGNADTLKRKRPRVVADPGRRLWSQPFLLPCRFRVLGCCASCGSGSACHRSTHAGHRPFLLTDLLTRLVGTGETAQDADDDRRAHRQVSEMRRDAGDGEDARRMAHNPEVAGSNPAPLPRPEALSLTEKGPLACGLCMGCSRSHWSGTCQVK